MVERIAIDEIKIDREVYPRFRHDSELVNQYRTALELLPPIVISRDKVLIDGYHRLLAYQIEGHKEIPCEISDVSGLDLRIEAIRRNSTGGKQLSNKEKKENARKLYIKYRNELTQEQIAKALSVSQQVVSNWIEDLVEKETEKEDQEILELYLQCYTQEEIAEKFGCTHKTISNRLRKVFGKNAKDGKITKTPENLQLFNTFSTFQLAEDQLKYPGQLPYDLVENVVYYYSDEPKLEPELCIPKVVDPMAGSGVVGEVCKKLLRRYMLFDINPLPGLGIEKADILQGLPEKARNADLVFFDPPYHNLLDDYPKNSFTASYSEFLEAMKLSLKNLREILREKGKLAVVLKPKNENLFDGEWQDMTVVCIEIARKLKLTAIKRIGSPFSTQQFRADQVSKAKESKALLNTMREICIFEKRKNGACQEQN